MRGEQKITEKEGSRKKREKKRITQILIVDRAKGGERERRIGGRG